MKRRFTDICKWEDPWFMDLSPEFKLLWLFVLDSCDHAGIWKFNMKLAEFKMGVQIAWGTGLGSVPEPFKERVEISPRFGDYWFIPKFLKFQYPNGLKQDSPPAKSALKMIDSLGFRDRVTELFGKGFITLKEKEREREREKSSKSLGEKKRGVERREEAKPLTDVQKIVTAFKLLEGFEKDDKAWDRMYFARFSKSASEILGFIGNWEDAVDCCQAVYEKLTEKGLTVTLETIAKHAGSWLKDKREQEGKRVGKLSMPGNGSGENRAERLGAAPVARSEVREDVDAF